MKLSFSFLQGSIALSLAFGSFMGISLSASALPFNTDMFEVQPSADAVARKKPEGSIAIGSIERQKPELTTSWVQKNPLQASSEAITHGQRKFEVNCSPCHGKFSGGVHQPSAIVAKGMPSIDLSSEAVRYSDPGTNSQPKPDAHFFTYIFNGGPLMPAYGYKLSNHEIWEIISYIRHVQFGNNVPSGVSPQSLAQTNQETGIQK